MMTLQLLEDALVVVLTGLPDYLHTTVLYLIQVLQHTLVHGAGSQGTAHDENGFLLGIQSELLDGFLMTDGCLQQRLSYGVSCHDDLLCREETVHILVGHADLLCFLGQQLVRDTCVGVLFLYQTGDSHGGALVQRRSAGVAAHTHCSHRTEVLDDAASQALTFPYLVQHLHVLQQVLPVEAAYRQSFDFISGSGNTLHLHAVFCTHEQDLCFRVLAFDGIGNGYSREDMSSCATSTDDNPQFLFHVFVV